MRRSTLAIPRWTSRQAAPRACAQWPCSPGRGTAPCCRCTGRTACFPRTPGWRKSWSRRRHGVLTPRLALEIALRAEQRAKVFFEKVLAEAIDAGIREVARDMARDEQAHIAWVNEELARVPKPYRPSEEQPGDPTM